MTRQRHRVLLLVTPRTYRLPAFAAAAERLGIDLAQAIDMPQELADEWQMELGVDFNRPETAVAAITKYAQDQPLDAILAVDDSGALLAAEASAALGLPHNDVAAAEAARNKYRMRQRLHTGGVAAPRCRRFFTDDDLGDIAAQVDYPCVVKPTELSGSRGVIRANDPGELRQAINRLTKLLHSLKSGRRPFLVEEYVPGVEVALEGMVENGRLTVLALFDKPDPLDGPFFEETIYTTPSRLPQATQQAVADCAVVAAEALGLRTGPVHAELRVNERGPWLIEIAGRSIGGLCSRTLRFGTAVSLEELILRQACGLPQPDTHLSRQASGVMMIPIPEAGLLKGISGCDEARAVPLIEDVEITAKVNYPLTPLPEGDSYLGFIFARGETPAAVEAALREAHSKLYFEIAPLIQLQVGG